MKKKIKLAFDIMGVTENLHLIANATANFLKTYNDVHLFIVGNKILFLEAFGKTNHRLFKEKLTFINTNSFIKQDDNILEIKRQQNASINLAINLLTKNQVDCLLTACSTAALIFAIRDKIQNKEIKLLSPQLKPAFMTTLPTIKENKLTVFLDLGINLKNNAKDLLNFALIGSTYMEKILGAKRPKVALLNIGEEENKGHSFHLEAYQTLKKNQTLNFIGNIEPRYLLDGEVDVIISDGYSANICLKAIEGAYTNLFLLLKKSFKNISWWKKLFAFFFKKELKKLKTKFDYHNIGGAQIVGINKVILKVHGLNNEKNFFNGLKLSRKVVLEKFLKKLEQIF